MHRNSFLLSFLTMNTPHHDIIWLSLNLPNGTNVHLVFHVSRLKEFLGSISKSSCYSWGFLYCHPNLIGQKKILIKKLSICVISIFKSSKSNGWMVLLKMLFGSKKMLLKQTFLTFRYKSAIFITITLVVDDFIRNEG